MKLFSVVALTALPLINAAPAEVVTRNGQHKTQGLSGLVRKSCFLYFGTAIDNPSLNNSNYMSTATDSHMFEHVTPVTDKNGCTLSLRETSSNSMGDAIILPAIHHCQLRHYHSLVWHSQLPDWLTGMNYVKAELISILEDHVAHEALNEDGTLRSDLWLTIIGPKYSRNRSGPPKWPVE